MEGMLHQNKAMFLKAEHGETTSNLNRDTRGSSFPGDRPHLEMAQSSDGKAFKDECPD